MFWTADEKQKMLTDYRRAHLARCPRDRALLTVTDLVTGREPDDDYEGTLGFTCPACMRLFDSTEIEPTIHDGAP